MRVCNRKLADRIRSAEQRLTLIRLNGGTITDETAQAERQLQQQANDDIATLAAAGYNKYGVKEARNGGR